MRFIVDEDLTTDTAVIGRRFGLDIVSVHENGREEWTDEEQLVQAAEDHRCIVTANRNNFINLTQEFAAIGRPHAGVLIVTDTLRRRGAAAMVRSILAFNRSRGSFPDAYPLDFL